MKRASKSRKTSKSKNIEAKLRSSSSSITDEPDDAQCPPPIFLLVHFTRDTDREYSILKLNGDDLKSKVVCFKVSQEFQTASWLFSHPTSSSEEMFMLPARPYDKRLPAYKFDFRTAGFEKITTPLSSKWCGHVVNLNGRIYYMEQPEVYYDRPASAFECYDPSREKWGALTPFPDPPDSCRIQATAVWDDDTILYNIVFLTKSSTGSVLMDEDSVDIWAYVVSEDKWYEVYVEDDLCCTILGEAVVQGDTIYGLTSAQYNSLLALSIEKNEIGGDDVVFKCSLRSKILMPGVKPLYDSYGAWSKSRHLVHLGQDYFCIVQCCVPVNFRGYQPIQLIYMKLEGKVMRKMYERVHKWEIHPEEHFNVKHCFPLPEGMTTALEEGKAFDFELVPEPEVAKKGQSEDELWEEFLAEISAMTFESCEDDFENLSYLQMPSLDEVVKQADEEKTLASAGDKEGCSIVVRNLPKNVNVTQVEKGLKKEFGPIKKGGIKLKKNGKGKNYAYVEFESETSKQRAIERASITIEDCSAKISNK